MVTTRRLLPMLAVAGLTALGGRQAAALTITIDDTTGTLNVTSTSASTVVTPMTVTNGEGVFINGPGIPAPAVIPGVGPKVVDLIEVDPVTHQPITSPQGSFYEISDGAIEVTATNGGWQISFVSFNDGAPITMQNTVPVGNCTGGRLTCLDETSGQVDLAPYITSNTDFHLMVTSSDDAPAPAPAPEPGTIAVFGAGLAALGLFRRRKLG